MELRSVFTESQSYSLPETSVATEMDTAIEVIADVHAHRTILRVLLAMKLIPIHQAVISEPGSEKIDTLVATQGGMIEHGTGTAVTGIGV